MRLNQFIAQATGLSRRAADKAIAQGRVQINGQPAQVGQQADSSDTVTLDGRAITPTVKTQTIILNKPVGYVCSRDGQGSKTVYELLSPELHELKPVGRLDKDSSGLLLMTNDGQLAYELTHPKFQKEKVYEVELDRPLHDADKARIEKGVVLGDGISQLRVKRQELRVKKKSPNIQLKSHNSYLMALDSAYEVRLSEGRNRQIRRTFAALGYKVTTLHRTNFGPYDLGTLRPGEFQNL